LGPQAPDPDSGELTSGATRLAPISPWGDIDRYEINLAGLYKLSWPNLRCERVKWAWNRCAVCMT